MRVALFSGLAKDTGCWLKLGYLARALEKCGVDVVVFDPLPSMPLFLDFLLSIPWNFARVLCCRCDVLFGAKPFWHITLPFLVRKWLRKTWTVVDVDDLDWEYRSGVLRAAVRAMQSSCLRFMDMATYHNPMLMEPLRKDFRMDPARLHQLKQGVDFEVFDHERLAASSALEGLRIRYGISADDEVLIHSAHLNVASSLEGILGSFERVRREAPACKLLVIGGGDREGHYRQMARRMGLAEAVIFTGYLSPGDVALHVLLGAVALVYYPEGPANRYRSSMKLRELLAMGRIVVCNRTGEAEEFSDWLVVANSDYEGYAAAIRGAICSKTDLKGKAKRGETGMREQFDWAMIGNAFARELKARMGRRNPM